MKKKSKSSTGTVHDLFKDDRNPSEVLDSYWIMTIRKTGVYPPKGKPITVANSGKWLVFADVTQIDKIWKVVKDATENGLLGDSSKVSTAKPNPNSAEANKKVICVFTYDHTDEEDVMRIRQELRNLGVTEKIPYKSNAATREGQYQVRGHKRISIYYE